MATMIRSGFSVAKMLKIVKRHFRLSKQVFNDTALAAQMQPAVETLKGKMALLEEKTEAQENAYDDLVLADRLADDIVRDVFGQCAMFDRNNPGSNLLNTIFPDGTYGDIVRMEYTHEVVEMKNIATRLQNLGETHELYPWAAQLLEKAGGVEQAMLSLNTAIKDEAVAMGEIRIAKEELVRKYEVNYLDARKKYGKTNAEKLFPKFYTRSTPEESETEGSGA
jgi:hypothetical protein